VRIFSKIELTNLANFLQHDNSILLKNISFSCGNTNLGLVSVTKSVWYADQFGRYTVHFDQFDSHTSQAPVFCQKLVPVTGHGAQCQAGPTSQKNGLKMSLIRVANHIWHPAMPGSVFSNTEYHHNL
jgi:hypothetical protein